MMLRILWREMGVTGVLRLFYSNQKEPALIGSQKNSLVSTQLAILDTPSLLGYFSGLGPFVIS